MYNENNMQYNGLMRSEIGNIAGNYQSRSSRSRMSQQRSYQERMSQERMSQEHSSRGCCYNGSNAENRNCGCGESRRQETRQDNYNDNYKDNCHNNCHSNSQNCCESNWGLSDHPLSMMYSPYHSWRNVYKSDTALERGTMFAELDLPFEGSNCKR